MFVKGETEHLLIDLNALGPPFLRMVPYTSCCTFVSDGWAVPGQPEAVPHTWKVPCLHAMALHVRLAEPLAAWGLSRDPESEKELGHAACGSMDKQGAGSHPPGASFKERGTVNNGQELQPGKL